MAQSQVLYRSDTMSIEYYFKPDHKNRQLAFVFSSLGSKILNRNVNGGDYLIENGFDVVNFNSNRTDWFQNVPAHIFAEIHALNVAGSYEKRVAMGSSMGGYAAICFSKSLGCHICARIRAAAQCDHPIRPAICRLCGEHRMGLSDFPGDDF